jgi:molybdopterin/thiamine biosynthesis adenylyltransferase
MALSPDRLERFARHIVLPEIGGAGQAALAGATVVLIGLGGIGSPALQYLAAAGIGTLVLVDDDTVDLSNLQRQTIYREGDLGHTKTELAELWVREFDPVLERAPREPAGDARECRGDDRRRRPRARRLRQLRHPAGGVRRLRGGAHSAAFGRGRTVPGPGRRVRGALARQLVLPLLRRRRVRRDDCDTCAEDGMLGAMAGWTGTFAAMQAIRVLLAGPGGMGDPQWGKLHLLDGLAPSMRTLRIAKDPACGGCGTGIR